MFISLSYILQPQKDVLQLQYENFYPKSQADPENWRTG